MNKTPLIFTRAPNPPTSLHERGGGGGVGLGMMALVGAMLFVSLLVVPLDSAPVSTYLRGQDITQDNITGVITTIPTIRDGLACSVQCKKSPQCGGFTANDTGCFLYTAGVTYTDEAIVPVGYYPVAE